MPLVLRECGVANAFYKPADRSVILCYELLESVISGIDQDFGSAPWERKMDTAFGAIFFVLFHEIGHGLIHSLNLPIFGREEDAADSIAAYLTLRTKAQVSSVEGALWFFMRGASEPSLRAYAGAHSLGPQRAFNLLCQALGKDRVQFADLAAKLRLPPERMARCDAEYSKLQFSARALLGRYIIE
jgi:hypothetical protein